ncbi:MAG TPA: hypothetical protein VFC42_01440 [Methylomirabilota bacterium]|nr:hypothetical protein [Methylomirabilota bacterium]
MWGYHDDAEKRPPAPGPLEDGAARFDDLFSLLAQRRGFLRRRDPARRVRERGEMVTAAPG